MKSGWETDKERTRRFLKIPAGKKLEMLFEMAKFTSIFSTKESLRIRKKLRER